MRTFRNLTVLFLFVLATMSFHPVGSQAQEPPEPPETDCAWAEAPTGIGVWSCPWGCDYFYRLEGGGWVPDGQFCIQ